MRQDDPGAVKKENKIVVSILLYFFTAPGIIFYSNSIYGQSITYHNIYIVRITKSF